MTLENRLSTMILSCQLLTESCIEDNRSEPLNVDDAIQYLCSLNEGFNTAVPYIEGLDDLVFSDVRKIIDVCHNFIKFDSISKRYSLINPRQDRQEFLNQIVHHFLTAGNI